MPLITSKWWVQIRNDIIQYKTGFLTGLGNYGNRRTQQLLNQLLFVQLKEPDWQGFFFQPIQKLHHSRHTPCITPRILAAFFLFRSQNSLSKQLDNKYKSVVLMYIYLEVLCSLSALWTARKTIPASYTLQCLKDIFIELLTNSAPLTCLLLQASSVYICARALEDANFSYLALYVMENLQFKKVIQSISYVYQTIELKTMLII